MKTLTGISLVLVILLVSLSAYLRLSNSGIGCSDWPQCYGKIGSAPESGLSAPEKLRNNGEDAYRKLLEQSKEPLSWATPLHRLVASVLGLMVLALNLAAFRRKQFRLVSVSLLGLTVFLAVLGIRSGSLHDPAVVMANLVGGFSMLGLLGWMWFRLSTSAKVRVTLSPALITIAIIALATQILLGGFTSANFAATACQTLPDCYGGWWPGEGLGKALDLGRTHEVTASGQAIGGIERMAIHKAHRLGALLAGVLILITGLLAMKSPGPGRTTGIVIVALVILEFGAGITSVLAGLPIVLAVSHNWLAGLLLLSLLKLMSLTRPLA